MSVRVVLAWKQDAIPGGLWSVNGLTRLPPRDSGLANVRLYAERPFVSFQQQLLRFSKHTCTRKRSSIENPFLYLHEDYWLSSYGVPAPFMICRQLRLKFFYSQEQDASQHEFVQASNSIPQPSWGKRVPLVTSSTRSNPFTRSICLRRTCLQHQARIQHMDQQRVPSTRGRSNPLYLDPPRRNSQFTK